MTKAERAALGTAIEYMRHDWECVRARFEAGEPTPSGGYRQKFAGKWYDSPDQVPPCQCGADDAIAAVSALLAEEEKRGGDPPEPEQSRTSAAGSVTRAASTAPAIPVVEPKRPTVVCLCGSTRFMEAFFDEGWRLTLEDKIVLSVGVCKHVGAEGHGAEAMGQDVADRLDELHLRKIDLADEVRVLNVGGYIGKSTRREIEYAERTGKPITYLEWPFTKQQSQAGVAEPKRGVEELLTSVRGNLMWNYREGHQDFASQAISELDEALRQYREGRAEWDKRWEACVDSHRTVEAELSALKARVAALKDWRRKHGPPDDTDIQILDGRRDG